MNSLLRLFHAKRRRIFCDPSSRCAREALVLQGGRFAEGPHLAEMLWLRKGHEKHFPHLQEAQLINHFPNQGIMINKVGLTETLKQFEKTHPLDTSAVSRFYQPSYCLHDPAERKAFFNDQPRVDTRENLWIYKPGNNSRGRGIEIMWRFNKLKRKLKPYGDRPIEKKADQGIMQRYIKNPLLLDGRKSEIRIYWMIASLDPLLVLMYPEATVRLNSLPFQLDRFDNQLIHVTNVYQQKHHPDYDPDVVLKWRFEELERYVSEELGLADAGWIERDLLPKIKHILSTVAHAAKPGLFRGYPHRGFCFAVYGADIILDDNLNPWLTEIQKGPGLSFRGDPVKQHVIPPMLGEATNLAFEIRSRRIRRRPLKGLKSVKRYQWVVNEIEPGLEPDLSSLQRDPMPSGSEDLALHR